MRSRGLALGGLWLSVLVLCWPAVRTIVNLGLNDDRFAQTVAAPAISLFLLYWDRRRILSEAKWSASAGTSLLLLAIAVYFALSREPFSPIGDIRLDLAVLATILAWTAGFIVCFGPRSLRAALFPLCCLLLMIPVPASFMDLLSKGLQHGSANVSVQLLRLAGVPVFAQGTQLLLPGLAIEVAPECSGIRSFVALSLVALVAGRVCLRSGWARLALILFTIPIAIIKNAIRISVIASMAAYVNRAFLYGRIHHYGGLVFTPLGVMALFALIVALQKSETGIVRLAGAPGAQELIIGR